MPLLTYDYVYFRGGPHTRQPRTTGATGGFIPIPGLSGSAGTLQQGSLFRVPAGALPPTENVAGATYSFAFVNVSGGNGGGQTSFDYTTPPAQVTVGAAPIVVLVVYLFHGSGNGGVHGASIDAFDETTGSLVDDDFVTVSPDAALTSSGNKEGWVPTAGNTEKISAYPHITPSDVYFDKWVNLDILPKFPPAGADFTAAKNGDFNALAFYASNACQASLKSLYVLIDAKRLPVSEVAGWEQQLKLCFEQHKITQAEYTAALNAIKALGSQAAPGKPNPPQ